MKSCFPFSKTRLDSDFSDDDRAERKRKKKKLKKLRLTSLNYTIKKRKKEIRTAHNRKKKLTKTLSLPHIHNEVPKISKRFSHPSKSEASLILEGGLIKDNDVVYLTEVVFPERKYCRRSHKIKPKSLEPSMGRRDQESDHRHNKPRSRHPREERSNPNKAGVYKQPPSGGSENVPKKRSHHRSHPPNNKSSKTHHTRRSRDAEIVGSSSHSKKSETPSLCTPWRVVIGLAAFISITISVVLLAYFLSPVAQEGIRLGLKESLVNNSVINQSTNNGQSKNNSSVTKNENALPGAIQEGGNQSLSGRDWDASGESSSGEGGFDLDFFLTTTTAPRTTTTTTPPYFQQRFYQRMIKKCRVHPTPNVFDYLTLRNRSESGLLLRYIEDIHRETVFFWRMFGLENANITTWLEVDHKRLFKNDGYKIETILQDVSGTLTAENIAAFKWIGLEKKKYYFQKVFFTQCWIRLLRSYSKYMLGISGFYGICEFSDSFYDFLDTFDDIPAKRPPSLPLGMSNCHPDRIREHGYYNFEDAYFEFGETKFQDYKGIINERIFQEYRENPNANFETEYYNWEYDFNDKNSNS